MNITAVTPDISVSEKAVITPASGIQVDLTDTIMYKVMAEDSSVAEYRVITDHLKNTENRISNFTVTGLRAPYVSVGATIDTLNKIIHADIFYGSMDKSNLKVDFTVPYGATATPASGGTIDFTQPVKFSVKAANGDVLEYTAISKNLENYFNYSTLPLPSVFENDYRSWVAQRQGAPISNFFPEDVVGVEDKEFVLYYALETENLSGLTFKNAGVSEMATVKPAFNIPQDFNKDVTYTVTSESGRAKEYVVHVVKKKVIFTNMGSTVSAAKYWDKMYNDYLVYNGGKFVRLWGVNLATGVETEFRLTGYSHNNWGFSYQSFETMDRQILPAGNYRLKVQMEDGSTELTSAILKSTN